MYYMIKSEYNHISWRVENCKSTLNLLKEARAVKTKRDCRVMFGI